MQFVCVCVLCVRVSVSVSPMGDGKKRGALKHVSMYGMYTLVQVEVGVWVAVTGCPSGLGVCVCLPSLCLVLLYFQAPC